jgi:murein DD-endopeptidase MepM/ murein hydrolase activator NlpD
MVRLRHAGGFATGYAHLSTWASELATGVHVRQGQVIGWTGDTGLTTGPHLHFEVLHDGQPIDPASAAPTIPVLSSVQLAAFAARQRSIDALLAAKTASHIAAAGRDPNG